MSKVKYYYDSENLAYKRIKPQRRKKFGYAFLFLLSSALFGFLCLILLINTPYFETPKDKLLTGELESMKLNYKLLNKKLELMDEVLGAIEDNNNDIQATWTLLRSMIRKQKIERIYGTKNTDRKEKF